LIKKHGFPADTPHLMNADDVDGLQVRLGKDWSGLENSGEVDYREACPTRSVPESGSHRQAAGCNRPILSCTGTGCAARAIGFLRHVTEKQKIARPWTRRNKSKSFRGIVFGRFAGSEETAAFLATPGEKKLAS
jgi:hypothetical protein